MTACPWIVRHNFTATKAACPQGVVSKHIHGRKRCLRSRGKFNLERTGKQSPSTRSGLASKLGNTMLRRIQDMSYNCPIPRDKPLLKRLLMLILSLSVACCARLSVPGSAIPHLWLSFRFLLFPDPCHRSKDRFDLMSKPSTST